MGSMSSREIIEIIERDGWYLVATVGSHRQFRHPTKPGKVAPIHAQIFLPSGF